MSDKETGGFAFPSPDLGHGSPYYGGMTLRDYFAANALQGIISCHDNNDFDLESVRRSDYVAFCKPFAKSSYLMADAMLEARKE